MTETSQRKQIASIGRVAGHDIPTEASRVAIACIAAGRASFRHTCHTHWAEHARSAVLAVVENHLAVNGKVVRGREESGMSRNAAEKKRARIVDFATHPVIVALFCRSNARLQPR